MRFWKSDKEGNEKKDEGYGKRYGWLCGVAVGVCLMATGIMQGQFNVIWKKAVMICLECIGIG